MRAVIATTVLSMALGLAGCSAGPGAHARVAKAPAPPLAASGVAPALSKDHPLSGWTLGRAERDDPEELIKWAAAREAFWNYDTDQAVKLLRELREEKVVNDDHFADLVRQCYASSGRWLDAAAIYAELGSEQDHSELLQYLRFRAGLPEMELAFAAGAAPVPFALKHGALVTVQAEINGRPARLLVDTGCGMTWVAESFARQAGVQIFEQTISLSDSNGRERPVPVGQVQRLQVGGLTVRNLPIIMSSSLFMALGTGVDGILGWDVLQHADVTWDFPAERMTLAAPAPGRSASPVVAGRQAPLLNVLSAEGRALYLFFDSGWIDSRGNLELYDNDGILATKTNRGNFRRTWRPVFQLGLHSFSVSWPRRAKPFIYWMDGYRFEAPGAWLVKGVHRYEHSGLLDGIIGNMPFLDGKLRLCGVRREASFELTPKVADASRPPL